jgi:hypothetical protein
MDTPERNGVMVSIGIIQEKNGYTVREPSFDYGRVEKPFFVASDIETAIGLAINEFERQIREFFQCPRLQLSVAEAVDRLRNGPWPVVMGIDPAVPGSERTVSCMKFADGRVHIISEGKPNAE